MTKAQRDALELLAIENRRTTTRTIAPWIGGRTACCLIRQGWARRVPQTWNGVRVPDSYEIEITDAGRAALLEAK